MLCTRAARKHRGGSMARDNSPVRVAVGTNAQMLQSPIVSWIILEGIYMLLRGAVELRNPRGTHLRPQKDNLWLFFLSAVLLSTHLLLLSKVSSHRKHLPPGLCLRFCLWELRKSHLSIFKIVMLLCWECNHWGRGQVHGVKTRLWGVWILALSLIYLTTPRVNQVFWASTTASGRMGEILLIWLLRACWELWHASLGVAWSWPHLCLLPPHHDQGVGDAKLGGKNSRDSHEVVCGGKCELKAHIFSSGRIRWAKCLLKVSVHKIQQKICGAMFLQCSFKEFYRKCLRSNIPWKERSMSLL